ncbi:MAG: acyl--CoA ligase [Pirellulales bacterium]|nr:acyl--CoA ligase [Pirellulales bacterium]
MINSLDNLIGRLSDTADRPAIATSENCTTGGELANLVTAAATILTTLRKQRVGVVHRGDASSWAALAALDRLASNVFLLDAELPESELQRLAADFRLAAIVGINGGVDRVSWPIERFTPSAGSGESSITILTSGTTGKPKAAEHTWASLGRPVRITPEAASLSWLLTYRPHLYAGLQVGLQCFANGGTLVVPCANDAVDRIVKLMVRQQVACVSATPSYWRQLLIFSPPGELAKVHLRQITLGGEVVDQQVLDLLKGTFPAVRIVHLYATTELGRCFSVTDGQAGFPARYLDAVSSDGVELRVHENELQVRSANSMRRYDSLSGAQNRSDDWFATGDLVRLEGDRYYFVGRESDIINVGGNKVSPHEVEQCLRAVPGVADVRVYGKKSSMVGQLVAAQIVPQCAHDAEAVRAAIIEAGLRQLTPPQRPRLIEMVERIELSNAGKTRRR